MKQPYFKDYFNMKVFFTKRCDSKKMQCNKTHTATSSGQSNYYKSKRGCQVSPYRVKVEDG